MRDYLNRLLSVSWLFIAAAALSTGCIKVDNTLGTGFIPEDQIMKVGKATFGETPEQAVKAYYTFIDSVYTKNQTALVIGNASNEGFGAISAASINEFLPTSTRVDTTEHGFGLGVAIDSVKIIGSWNRMTGDKDIVQNFNIYRYIADTLLTDSLYYADFKWRDKIDPAPLFTFNYSGESDGNIEYIKTTITGEGMAFLEEAMSDTTLFNPDNGKKFREKFHGLVIAPADDSPKDAAVYFTNLSYTYIGVYFHNYTDETLTEIKDEATMLSFQIDDSSDYTPRNKSVLSIQHDFTGTPLENIRETPVEADGGLGRIQGLCGITTLLEFPDGLFDAINGLKEADTDDIFINQARMYVTLHGNEDTEITDNAFQKLGSYIEYKTAKPIPDYYYSAETSGSIAYDGTLNRTHGYYMMDITAYLQQALDGKLERKFTLAPVAYPSTPNAALPWKETVLKANPEAPIKIEITYTLIK